MNKNYLAVLLRLGSANDFIIDDLNHIEIQLSDLLRIDLHTVDLWDR